RVPAGIANARAPSVAAPIANRELQKSTGGGQKCSQLFPVEHEGGGKLARRMTNAGHFFRPSERVPCRAEILPVARHRSATRPRCTRIRDVIRARSRPCRPRPSTAHLISRADDNCHSERTRKMPRIVSGLFGGTSNKNPRGVSMSEESNGTVIPITDATPLT